MMQQVTSSDYVDMDNKFDHVHTRIIFSCASPHFYSHLYHIYRSSTTGCSNLSFLSSFQGLLGKGVHADGVT